MSHDSNLKSFLDERSEDVLSKASVQKRKMQSLRSRALTPSHRAATMSDDESLLRGVLLRRTEVSRVKRETRTKSDFLAELLPRISLPTPSRAPRPAMQSSAVQRQTGPSSSNSQA